MQKQGGGGNDPSCGCDMQAGWPPASEFPRGGLQGGGAINSFNLALTNNEGKITHYRGNRTNGNGNANANANANANLNQNNNTNLNQNNTLNQNSNLNQNNNNRNQNANQNNTNQNQKTNNNVNLNLDLNENENETEALNAMLSERNEEVVPKKSSLEKIVFKGKHYYTHKNTGNAYTRSKNGKQGSYVGRFVENSNGKLTLDTSLPASGTAPPSQEIDIETEGVGVETAPKSLTQKGGSDPVCGSCPFPGTGACPFYARGGGCGCGMRQQRGGSMATTSQRGGGCPCSAGLGLFRGGYRATRKNLKALRKWKQGKSIGFTMTSSLKAKGLIPRTSRKLKGKKVVSRKYR
jgi:hypothetical protein